MQFLQSLIKHLAPDQRDGEIVVKLCLARLQLDSGAIVDYRLRPLVIFSERVSQILLHLASLV